MSRSLHPDTRRSYRTMNLPLQIAWRYLKRPADPLISAVGTVSVLGLVIGVMALVISMALMTGYRDDLQQKLLGGNAELFLHSLSGTIEDPDAVLQLIRRVPGVAQASPVLFQHALASSEELTTGEQVMLKGIEPSRAATAPMLAKVTAGGKFVAKDGSPAVAVGKYLAKKLRVKAGSSLVITVPTENAGSFLPRTSTFLVSNVFDTGFYEFDSRWIFLDLEKARSLFQAGVSATLIEVKLAQGAELDRVSRGIEEATGGRYAISDWRAMNRQLFSLLEIQQIVLFIVIGLIVFVSTFNIVSTLIMTVHEKKKEIGILASMGAERKLIRRVFIWYGTLVGGVGTLIGLLLGTLVCAIVTRYELVSFGPEIAEVYFVSSIPFVTRARDLMVIAGFAIGVSFLATLLPSMRAARLRPVDALRHS